MGSRADLHTHSTFSDGVLTPTELIALAYKGGVRVMSLSDHDTTEGLPQAFAAAARHTHFILIPGLAIAPDTPGIRLHIPPHPLRRDTPWGARVPGRVFHASPASGWCHTDRECSEP